MAQNTPQKKKKNQIWCGLVTNSLNGKVYNILKRKMFNVNSDLLSVFKFKFRGKQPFSDQKSKGIILLIQVFRKKIKLTSIFKYITVKSLHIISYLFKYQLAKEIKHFGVNYSGLSGQKRLFCLNTGQKNHSPFHVSFIQASQDCLREILAHQDWRTVLFYL